MKINKLIYPSVIMILSMIIMTGCNKKDEEISSYDKPDNGISNIGGYTSNSNDTSNQLSNYNSNDITSNNQSNITSNGVNSNTPSHVTSNKTSNQVTSSVSQIKLENGSNLVVVKGYDSKGNVVWSYKTKSVYRVGSEGPEYYEGKTNVYVNDGGNLVALNRATGKKLWTKTDYESTTRSGAVEVNGKLCIVSNGSSYQLLVLNMSNGKTIKKIVSFGNGDVSYDMLGDIKVKSNSAITFTAEKTVNSRSTNVKLELNLNNYSIQEIK